MPASRNGARLVPLQALLPGALSDSIPTPVPTMSGFARQSIAVGPRELNLAIELVGAIDRAGMARSPPRSPTHGAFPGAVMPPYWTAAGRDPHPRLPAAATTTSPASTARLVASVSGFRLTTPSIGSATDKLTTRMLYMLLTSTA